MDHTSRGRRHFIKTSASALAGSLFLPGVLSASDRPKPSERISIGIIGLGARGFQLLNEFLELPDVQVTAICDVHDLHYRDLEWKKGPAYGREPARAKIESSYSSQTKSGIIRGVRVFADPRELLVLDDLDAVVVATPDHWHAWCTIQALRHGKDVYCEKPVTHTFHEGQLVRQEIAARKAVFQTGSQQRSESLFQQAVEIVRNGHLGKLKEVLVGLPSGYPSPMGDPTIVQPPLGLDYSLWCGPSEELPYQRARHHRWWRGTRVYGGGVLMDWIGHHNDIAHWGLGVDRSGPLEIEAVNWTFPETDVYDTPQHYTIRSVYPGGIVSKISDSNPIGTKWIGENGWLYVSRKGITASESRWTDENFDAGEFRVDRLGSHVRNFVDCVKTRKECVSPVDITHRSITPGHLGYVSNTLKRSLKWDATTETVKDDEQANRLLHEISYRTPWILEQKS